MMHQLPHLLVCLVGLSAILSRHSVVGQKLPILINCGGPDFQDRDGNEWKSDRMIAKSSVESYKTKDRIQSSNKDQLYQTELYDADNDKAEFGVALPNGVYQVTLHFAEIYPGNQKRNSRVFDIWLQDMVVYRNLDIFGMAGPNTALTMDFTAGVRNGVMTIDLKKQKQNPKISGIEIRPMEDMPKDFKTIRINCGGRSFRDRGGHLWQQDLYYNGASEEYDTGARNIRGTSDDILYLTERFDRSVLKYEIPNIPEGAYRVMLHFSENWFTSQNEYARGKTLGARVFDIAIEGTVLAKSFDIYREGGEYTAVIKELPAYVDDGALSIELRAIKTFPKISGIEVYAVNDVYRWDNYDADGLNLIVMNAMDTSWRSMFQRTVDTWNNGRPDSLTLFEVQSAHDSDCVAIPNQIVICNGDYGDKPWTGLNTITLSGGFIRNSVARLNDYYLKGASDDLKQYALCHELGHAFGLPHTDEEYYNEDRGDCLDYTVVPGNNLSPGQYNLDLLNQIYGTADRRMLRKKRKRTTELALPPPNNRTKTSSNKNESEEEGPVIKEPTKQELRLYRDFVSALEVISCDEWNEQEKIQATKMESNGQVEVCELEFGEDYYVQVRKLLYFEGWEEKKPTRKKKRSGG